MDTQTFLIRSIAVQNVIMGIVVAIIVGLLVRFVRNRNFKYTVAVVIWGAITVWFFNGPFWGFSAVSVGPQGLTLHYGFLSVFRNTTLPVDSRWKIRAYLGGIRKMKRLYFFQLPGHESLKVRGTDKLEILKALGTAIDRVNGRPMGGIEERPVNM